jgi:thiol:disulfide interchange protein DsbD
LRRLLVLFVAALGLAGAAAALEGAAVRTPNVEARLVAETDGVRPGGTVTLALRLQIREHWHTYWLNPGDSGEPTAIDWTLPDGVAAGPLQFPYPSRIEVGPLVNFGYGGTVLHLADLTAPADAAPGTTIPLKAHAVWLVCDDICIPEEASLTLDLPVLAAPAPADAAHASEFAATRAALPAPSPWPAAFALQNGTLAIALDAPELARANLAAAILFPAAAGYIKNAAPQTVDIRDGRLVIAAEAGRHFATPEKAAKVAAIPAVLVLTGQDGQTRAFELTATPGPVPAPAAPREGALSLWTALGFAFLGGLILNLMPCVFPVLSMKALALAKKGGGDLAGARAGGFAYTAGVVLSFLALGGALVALRGAGEAVGWGFQLQSPLVVAALALVFFAIGLNLMGVFEVGTRLQTAGGARTGEGLAGSFLTGVLAAVVAAPCTAPFMGGAIFTALTQPVPVALTIFAALGLGMAAPYLALTLSPGLVRLMPKPGLWMVRLKQVLAFPMFGSAAWLVWVLSLSAGPQALALVLAAFVVAGFALWLWGVIQQSGGGWMARGAAASAALAVLAALAILPGLAAPAASAASEPGSGPKWEAYTPARLDALRAEGKPVFVNLTAAWCVTCLVNEEVALSSPRLAAAFEKAGIVYLKGDWTNRDADISRLLEAHGRAGVPLYLYFAPGAAEPAILPQFLTEGIVTDALGLPPPPAA